jgi:hypothetical protein
MTIEHYNLYDSKPEQRFIITTEQIIQDGVKQEKGTMAESWLDAKQRFGFELSAEQKRLLAKQGIPEWQAEETA